MRPVWYFKPPAEVVDISRDFTGILSSLVTPNQTISSITSIVISVLSGVSVTPLVIQSSQLQGNVLIMRISGGTDGVQYLITMTCLTSNGETVQDTGILPVRIP